MNKALRPALGLIAVLAGCSQPTAKPYFYDYPVIKLSSEWLEFGELDHGDSDTRTFTIQNTGDLTLGVASITEGPGQEDNFEITFNSADISCPAEAEEGEDTGGGDEADAKSAAGVLTPDHTTLDFGNVASGDSETEILKLTNDGDADITVNSATISPSSAPFSMVTDPAGETVPVGQSVSVVITYAPEDAAGDSADLIIVYGESEVLQVELVGNQEGPGPDDSGGGDDSEPPADDTGSSIDDTDVEEVDENVLFTLDSGCKIPVTVAFSPVDVGEIYGSVIVETITQPVEDDADPEYWSDVLHSRSLVYLQGEGRKGQGRAIVQPRSVDYGHVWTGETEVQYVQIVNAGDGELTLDAPTLDETCDPAYSISWSYAPEEGDVKVLEGGAKTLVELSFTPEDQNGAYCSLNILSDDADNPEIAIYVQGNAGVDPENVPPTVAIRSPESGYQHNSIEPMQVELNVFDKNQPATSLTCKIKSAVNVQANVADCTPSDESGHVYVDIDVGDFDAGVDTLLVKVTDASYITSYASISIVMNSVFPESDDDGDGFGTVDTGLRYDCDDTNRSTYPKAAEIHDGEDNDCDLIVDEGTDGSDDDGDSFTEADGDCDDADDASYPGAPEAADHKDDDCDGVVDEQTTLYDDDGDGYAEVNNDCNDANVDVNPGIAEICDDLDNDCNGKVDDGCLKVDSEPLIVGGIKMGQTAIEVEESVNLSVYVYEADGPEITYTWTDSDGGTIDDPFASSISWSAPDELPDGASDGDLYQVYVVVQDEDGHQTWDFAEVAVYPKDSLYQQFVEIVVVEPEGCSTVGFTAGLFSAFGAFGLAALRRRREDELPR